MLHRVAGRKLGRTKNERRALFRLLANQLILNEKLVTTEAKAKAVRPWIEKLVTTSKAGTIHARRLLLKELVSENTVQKMIELVGPKFKNRPGGYTRLVRLSARFGDRAPMVSLMFVESPSEVAVAKKIKTEMKSTDIADTENLQEPEIEAVAEKKPRRAARKEKTNAKE